MDIVKFIKSFNKIEIYLTFSVLILIGLTLYLYVFNAVDI